MAFRHNYNFAPMEIGGNGEGFDSHWWLGQRREGLGVSSRCVFGPIDVGDNFLLLLLLLLLLAGRSKCI